MLGQRILPAGRPRTRAEETDRIDLNRFAGHQLHIQVRDGDIRIKVNITNPPHHARRGQRIHGNRLRPAALGDLIEIRNEPFLGLTRADPNGVPTELDLITARNRRLEGRELWFDRLIGTGDHAHALEFALCSVGLTSGRWRLACPHFWLRHVAQRRESCALGGCIKNRILHRTRVAPLIAGIVTLGNHWQFFGRGH